MPMTKKISSVKMPPGIIKSHHNDKRSIFDLGLYLCRG
jgi:hypothetical protein